MSKKGRFRSLEANQKLMFTLRDRKRKELGGKREKVQYCFFIHVLKS